jgi:hypothetical protein
VRLSGGSRGAALLATLLLAGWAGAESATTRERARLRQGPSAATELLGEVAAGTTLEMLGESGGWRQVRTPDGTTGWVWSEHLAPRPDEAKPAEPARPATPPRASADDLRDLRDDVRALRERPEPASAAALERVRQEVERLTSAERDLARRFDDRFLPAVVRTDSPGDGAALWPALLAAGAAMGFIASRVFQRRRDRRQRGRLRL